MSKYLTIFLLMAFICFIPVFTSAQTSKAKQDFYNSEIKAWKEYAENFKTFSNNSDFDISFYNINVDISLDKKYLLGNVICRFTVKKDFINSITLNLQNAFSIDSITGNVSGFKFAGDSIEINLDKSYSTNEIAEINIYYQGIPPLAGDIKGLVYAAHGQNEIIIASLSTPFLAHYWWPCKDGPGDKADSVYINITIPDTTIEGIPVIAVSNGILENVVIGGGKKTFQWRHRYPIVPYYVMAAVSNYKKISQLYENNNTRFPLDYYVFNENYQSSLQGTADIPEVIKFFSSLFGEYPFSKEKYGMTELGFYGAIENQTNTIINNMSPDWFTVSVHEFAHMWFGDMITCKNWHHAWLNEGFATYCEALWLEHTEGFDAYMDYLNTYKYLYGGTIYLQDISDPFQIFKGIVYDKGAYLLHMLRGVLGDSIFFKCLYEYANDPRYKYREAETEDFKNVCEKVSGTDLDYFFDEWVYDEYFPFYQYSYNQNNTTLETQFNIKQVQGDLGRREVFKMPVRVRFNFTNGKDTLITVWNDEREQSFTFNFNYVVKNCVLDPDDWILKETKIISGINNENEFADGFFIYQNYPNPFNPTTTIKFKLTSDSFVILKIYDMLGNEIVRLINDDKTAGVYETEFNANNLASGIYFYRLTAEGEKGKFSEVKSMLLLK